MQNLKVVAAIFVQEEKILAMKRAAHKPLPGKWEFPGGKIENNESAEEALIREIKEELNIDINQLELFDHSITLLPDWEVDLSCFLVQTESFPTKSTDHDAMRWLDKKDLLELDWSEADMPAVRKLMGQH
jgi:8-oxo-dGTP diphosphatase